jgi:hypothetical protein
VITHILTPTHMPIHMAVITAVLARDLTRENFAAEAAVAREESRLPESVVFCSGARAL